MPKILWWKKISELENDLYWAKRDKETLAEDVKQKQAQIDKLKSIIRGERICEGYCVNCKHKIEEKTYHQIGFSIAECRNIITCDLDCKCPDFQKKEDE